MDKEDKELLLKDLCARLPYKIKLKTPNDDAILVGIANRKGVKKDIDYIDVLTDKQIYPIQYIKPYLRPMSSMTREECNEHGDLCHVEVDTYANIYEYDTIESIDWLNAHHFDYRGLIEKGLALEASKEMYEEKTSQD